MTGNNHRIVMSGLLSLVAIVCSTTLAAGDTILWSENFDGLPNGSDPAGWNDPNNRYQVIDDAYSSLGQGDVNIARAYFNSEPFPMADFIYSGEIHFPTRPGPEGAGLLGFTIPSYSVVIFNRGNDLGLFRFDGLWTSVTIPTEYQVRSGDTVRLRMIFDGHSITGQMADLSDPMFLNPRAEVSGSFAPAFEGGVGLVNYSREEVIFDNLMVTPVPEPAAAALLALGGLAMLIRRR